MNYDRALRYYVIPLREYGEANVRFGSKADMSQCNRHVRFTPESGHVQCNWICPLSAKSGHGDLRAKVLVKSFLHSGGNGRG